MNNVLDIDLETAFQDTYQKVCSLFDGEEGRPYHLNPVAAFQFAATFFSAGNYHIQTLSIANEAYTDLLDDFITTHGSILFSESKKDKEKYSLLNGTEKIITQIKSIPKNFIPPKGIEKVRESCSFLSWNQYLSEKDFGKFSVWLSLVDKLQENWRFSIDIFLILNIDLREKLPPQNDTYSKVSADNLEKWKFRQGIFEHLYSLSNDYGIGVITKALNKAIRKQTTRAAISQVMARNMSHNIGSHVLSRMEAPSDNQYKGFLLNSTSTDTHEKLISTFHSYLKSRMDFLADVTTGVPTIENSKWFYKELLSGIDKNRLLLNRISGIGDFHYQIQTVNFVENPLGAVMTDGENDLMVSIPNDVLGCHAFYTIIENIIRNCAKHGGKGNKGKTPHNPLNICINIKECEEQQGNELYEITIYDDGEDLNDCKPILIEEKEAKGKYQEYFSEENGKISIKPLDKLVFDQNYRINQSILKDGALRQGAWGLIEMDASAAYLRKIPVEQIDENIYDINLQQTPEGKESLYPENVINPEFINILKAVAVDERFLGYRLFMFKPREILIIDDIGFYKNIDNSQRKELLKSGILICKTSETESYFKYNSEKVYNHKLVVILSDRPDEIIKSNITGLSRRVLRIKSGDINNECDLNLLPSSPQDFKEGVWRKYIKSTNYQFYNRYFGFPDIIFLDDIQNKLSSHKANFFDHGKNYDHSEIKFKEIIYSAVEGFMPTADDEIKLVQFIESIHNRIVIIDERIQEYAQYGVYKPESENEIKVKDIYEHTNIYVPDHSVCNLGLQNFDEEYDKILEVFRKEKKACFFVIHLGVIEKLIQSHNKKEGVKITFDKDIDTKIGQFLEEMICNPNEISYNKLIIISGRGTPHNLPPNTRYLNYSIISQYMIDLRFKYLLSEAVFSSRKIKNY